MTQYTVTVWRDIGVGSVAENNVKAWGSGDIRAKVCNGKKKKEWYGHRKVFTGIFFKILILIVNLL